MIQLAGKNYIDIFMPDLIRFEAYIFFTMIINDHNSPGHNVIALPFLLNNISLDQLPDGLGAVGKLIIPDVGIEGFQQFLLEADSETGYCHRVMILIIRNTNIPEIHNDASFQDFLIAVIFLLKIFF